MSKENFSVLDGGKDLEIAKYKAKRDLERYKFERLFLENYRDAVFSSPIDIRDELDRDCLKKACYYGVRYMSRVSYDGDYADVTKRLSDWRTLLHLIEQLNYKEFETIFPISKYYDDFDATNYFRTKNFLSQFNPNDKISDAIELLSNYGNPYTSHALTNSFLLVNRQCVLEGKKNLLESFIEENGLADEIQVFGYDKETNTMYDKKTGEEFEVKKSRAKTPLKVVKSNEDIER